MIGYTCSLGRIQDAEISHNPVATWANQGPDVEVELKTRQK